MAYEVPDLPYDYDALEPHIDEQTMKLHHDKHHQAYVDKANAALEGTEWADKDVDDVLKSLSDLPDDDPRVNPWGGAIAVGHPLASSGVRLMIQLARQFEKNLEVRYGLTAMFVGLGQGGSVIWENPHWTKKAGRK